MQGTTGHHRSLDQHIQADDDISVYLYVAWKALVNSLVPVTESMFDLEGVLLKALKVST
jgi:hypothetical protein